MKEWKIALPLHIEYRTLPMLFYVPPMPPVMSQKNGTALENVSEDLFHDIDEARVPMRYPGQPVRRRSGARGRYALRKQTSRRRCGGTGAR